MQTAKVLGTTRATIKHASFVGQKLLIVQPTMANGSNDGPPLLSLDSFGASPGDTVLLTSDSSCMEALISKDKNTPARWCTMGIVDQR